VPTGSITFQVGGSSLPNGTVTLSNGSATLNTTALPVGTDNLVASYSGDSQFGANISVPESVTVGSAAQIQLVPGLISQVSGSYFTTSTTGPANNTPANSAQYPAYIEHAAVDIYGNIYVPNGTTIYATYSAMDPSPASPTR
jgi:hypothetical protein